MIKGSQPQKFIIGKSMNSQLPKSEKVVYQGKVYEVVGKDLDYWVIQNSKERLVIHKKELKKYDTRSLRYLTMKQRKLIVYIEFWVGYELFNVDCIGEVSLLIDRNLDIAKENAQFWQDNGLGLDKWEKEQEEKEMEKRLRVLQKRWKVK